MIHPADQPCGTRVSRSRQADQGDHGAPSRRLLGIEALSTAVRIIHGALRIETYGFGGASPVAEDLAYRLL